MSLSTQSWEIVHYFDYSDAGIDVEEEGLGEMRFGEFLVERGRITRAQLLVALMEQDKAPDTPIGVILVSMNVLPLAEMNTMLREFQDVPVVEVP